MIWNGWRRHNLSTAFRVSRHSLPQLVILGILMALSSLTLFLSYNYMPVGIASTLLFTYPILVAVIMTLVYHEPMSWLVVICLLLATSGVGMLCEQTPPSPLLRGETPLDPSNPSNLSNLSNLSNSPWGVSPFMIGALLVLLSSLSYAIYLVGLNKTRVRTIASMPVTLCALFWFPALCVAYLLRRCVHTSATWGDVAQSDCPGSVAHSRFAIAYGLGYSAHRQYFDCAVRCARTRHRRGARYHLLGRKHQFA